MSLVSESLQRRAIGTTLLNRGLFVAARDEFLRWLSLVEDCGDPALIIPPLNALAKVASIRGESEAALAYLQRALTLAEDPVVSKGDKFRVYNNLIRTHTDLVQLDDALGYSILAEGILEAQEPALRLAHALNMGLLYWRRQEWVPMLHVSSSAVEQSKVAGDAVSSCRALLNRGIAHLELGAYRLAERDLMNTLQLHAEVDSSVTAAAYAEAGRLHFLRGEYAKALEAGREALGTLLTDVAVMDKEEVARVSHLFGSIFAMTGQRNLALKYLNRSAAYFSQLGLRAEWQRSTEQIGEVLSSPVRSVTAQAADEVQRLDFVTAVLDLTDDLESVDSYLRGRSERIASLSVLLGDAVGLSENDLKVLAMAARLHDVGMIAVDTELIRREGPLSEKERKRVAAHTEVGEEMMRPYGLPSLGLEAIRHHHEHFDGRGYPDGLCGEAIPLMARIVAVVDVYDALTSDRAYRGALNHEEAVRQLRSMAGSRLDPTLVNWFLKLQDV